MYKDYVETQQALSAMGIWYFHTPMGVFGYVDQNMLNEYLKRNLDDT